MSYYLIDYENVRDSGLTGADKLTADDSILILYTKNANKICLDSLQNLKAVIKILKVPAGKQSLDMHISSMLGYLVGKSDGNGKYVIISKDSDFDSIIATWNTSGEGTFLKQPAIGPKEIPAAVPAEAVKPAAIKQAPAKQTAASPAPVKQASVTPVPAKQNDEKAAPAKQAAEKDVPARQSDEKAAPVKLDAVNPTAEAPVPEASAAVAEPAAEKPADTVKASSRQKKKNPSQPKANEAVSEKTLLNNRLVKMLRESGVDGPAATAAASVVMKNLDKDNRKQLIYRALLQKFGQKNGLAYYTVIKGEL